MNLAILVCIMTLTVGTFATCPSPLTGTGLTTLLTSDLTCLQNATTALSSNPCFGNILGSILSLVTGLVTGLPGILVGLIGNGLLLTPTSNGIDQLVNYTCQLAQSIPANTTSIPPPLCSLLNCLIKLVLDLLSGLILLIAGLLSTVLSILNSNLKTTLTTLVGQLTKFVGCVVTLATVTCLHDTLCNVKSTVSCVVAQLTAAGIDASVLNATVANIAPLTCP